MKLTVLGCSGGIGRHAEHTTALLLDDDVLIDAGTGLSTLDLAQLARIDHVFLTHSHLDHIAFLPLMLDAAGPLRDRPVTVHATVDTLEALRKHIFNWTIWPDFTEIPSRARPCLAFRAIGVGQPVALGTRTITALPANHTVPAVGYQVDSGAASLAFSGDTAGCEAFQGALERIGNLRYLIVEAAFSDTEQHIAALSKHLCPQSLRTQLRGVRQAPEIFVTHLKPVHAELIRQELAADDAFPLQVLRTGQVFDF